MNPALFGPRPPADRRVMMHAVDAGNFPDGSAAAHFRCSRCGRDDGWTRCPPSQARKGRACPSCNPPAAGAPA